MRRAALLAATCLVLAGCSRSSSSPPGPSGGGDAAAPAPGSGASPAVVAPQIAYRYHYSFRLPGDAIAAAQARHVALCDQLGPARCHVVSSSLDTASGDDEAALTLEVAAPLARRFGQAMEQEVAARDGRATSNTVEAEDVSRQIVDGQARLRQKEILVQRLTQILATRDGAIGDLIQAETQVSQEQANLDQLRSELAALQGRVATSTIEAQYRSADGFAGAPLGDTARSSLQMYGQMMGGLLRMFIYLLPWLLSLAVLVALLVVLIRLLTKRGQKSGLADPLPPTP